MHCQSTFQKEFTNFSTPSSEPLLLHSIKTKERKHNLPSKQISENNELLSGSSNGQSEFILYLSLLIQYSLLIFSLYLFLLLILRALYILRILKTNFDNYVCFQYLFSVCHMPLKTDYQSPGQRTFKNAIRQSFLLSFLYQKSRA